MFGKTIDYYLLKPLAHARNRATEAELDEGSRHSTFTLDDARAYQERIRTVCFDGRLPIDPNLSYLDIGCGMGRLSIGLSLMGVKDVTGVDIVERHIEEAKKVASVLDESQRPRFHCVDIHSWETKRQYDVVFVLGAMEHIHDPAAFLALIPRFLKPSGIALIGHEPFQSPIGDHMHGFFRVQIPWRGLLFSQEAVLRLRSEYYRPTDSVTRYQDIVGGLNLMSFSQYLEYAHQAGLEFVFHHFNPQLKHHRLLHPLYPVSWMLTRIPKVRDFFIINSFSILRRRNDLPSGRIAGVSSWRCWAAPGCRRPGRRSAARTGRPRCSVGATGAWRRRGSGSCGPRAAP